MVSVFRLLDPVSCQIGKFEVVPTGVEMGLIGNILWFIFAGIWLAIGHLGSALMCFITIIGIPFGIQHMKLALIALAFPALAVTLVQTWRTPVSMQNFFDNAAPPATGERFETLLQHKNLVIERISSSSDISLTQYVQTQDEWVLLVQGTAEIEISGKPESLKSGDYVFLPANTPHCVTSVSDGALWLAVHLHPD